MAEQKLNPMEPEPSNAPGAQPGQAAPPQPPSPPRPAEPPQPGLSGLSDDLANEPPSTFIDPVEHFEQLAAKRRIETPGPEMPKIDLDALGATTMATVKEQAKQRMMGEFAPVWQEMQGIDQQLAKLGDDEFADDDKKKALMNRRQQLQATMAGPMRIANDLVNRQADQEGHHIIMLQEQAAAEYPEIADELLDLAAAMPAAQRANPTTYHLLAQQVYGRKMVADRGRARVSEAGTMVGMASGRTGTGFAPPNEVSSQEIERLRRMGLSGNALSQAAERLGRNR